MVASPREFPFEGRVFGTVPFCCSPPPFRGAGGGPAEEIRRAARVFPRLHAPAQRLEDHARRQAHRSAICRWRWRSRRTAATSSSRTTDTSSPRSPSWTRRAFSSSRRFPVENAWLGLAWSPDGTASIPRARRRNVIEELRFEAGRLKSLGEDPGRGAGQGEGDLRRGVAIRPDGKRLFAVNVFGQTLSAVDTRGQRSVVKTVPLAAEPYTCLVSADGKLRSSSRSGAARRSCVFDAETLEPAGEIADGEHPERDGPLARRTEPLRRLREHERRLGRWTRFARRRASRSRSRSSRRRRPDRRRTRSGSRPTERRSSSPTPTTTPSRSSTSRDPGGESRVRGWIPTGWYPTARSFQRRRKADLHPVRQGPGLHPPIPAGPQPAIAAAAGQYNARRCSRARSRSVPAPDDATPCARHTKRSTR